MSLSTILRAALRRWYITVPGVLLSLVIAITVFGSVPPKFTSSGIAVLVRQNNPTAPNSINPALGSDGTFTTTTLTLVQALDTPAVRAELGLREGGVDDFTISNADPGKATTANAGDHPFLYITTHSSDPQKSTEIVADVIAVARQKLAELQNDFHVKPQNQIKVDSVVDATPPKKVTHIASAVAGAALMLGILATCIVACAWDALIATQQRRQTHRSTSRAKENSDRPDRAATRVG